MNSYKDDPLFNQIINHTLKLEGNYVNNPKDKGKATKFGISQASYPNLDIANLTAEQAKEIYYNNYYKPIKALGIKDPRAFYALYDLGVNSGVGKAKSLYEKVGDNYGRLMDARRNYYANIIQRDPSQRIFEKGWNNRLKGVDEFVNKTFPSQQPQQTQMEEKKLPEKPPELKLPNLHKIKDILTDYTYGQKQPEKAKLPSVPVLPKFPEISDPQTPSMPSIPRVPDQAVQQFQEQRMNELERQRQLMALERQRQEEEKQALIAEQQNKFTAELMSKAGQNIASLGNTQPQQRPQFNWQDFM